MFDFQGKTIQTDRSEQEIQKLLLPVSRSGTGRAQALYPQLDCRADCGLLDCGFDGLDSLPL
jgi:hypothetical protein